ncbi:MAG: thioredoxin [Candidatus Omnitrophota bacterium]|nr:thioredoxin [Candidatus Omnitrophota bacterium]
MEVKLTSANFEKEVLQAKVAVLVDFWAPWCGPCKTIAPYVEELAKELEGKLRVAKLNVDEVPDIATRYTVMSIPTLLVFKEGKVMDKKVGAMAKRDLAKFIQPYI